MLGIAVAALNPIRTSLSSNSLCSTPASTSSTLFLPTTNAAPVLIVQDASACRQIWAVWPYRPIFTSTTEPSSATDTTTATAAAAAATASATPSHSCAIRKYGPSATLTRRSSGLRSHKSEYVDESVQSFRRWSPKWAVGHRICRRWSRSGSWRRRRDRVGEPCGPDGVCERGTDAAAAATTTTTITSDSRRTVSAGRQRRGSCEDADKRRLEAQSRSGNGRVETAGGEVSLH